MTEYCNPSAEFGPHGDSVETVPSVGYQLRKGWTTEPAQERVVRQLPTVGLGRWC
jgi:hypothetical protein